jgi:N-terminal domain of anti-restriction factor ArdC
MNTPSPARRPARKAAREAQLAELRERVLAQLRAIRSGEDWAGWLRLAARVRGHRFANVLLIAAQRPDASLVASYEQWQALGRQVEHGQRGIQFIAEPGAAAPPATGASDPGGPGRAAVKQNRRYRRAGPSPGHVWDVAQTSGAAMPTRPRADAAPPGVERPGFFGGYDACASGVSIDRPAPISHVFSYSDGGTFPQAE